MQTAAGMLTKPEAGVIVARPETMPEAAPRTLGFPLLNHSIIAQLRPPAAPAKWVAANALVASAPPFKALPPLNPNQPTQSRPVPIRLRTTLCGSIGSLGKPRRFPSTSAQISADAPELMCTTVPPAKSSTGILPPSAQLKRPPLPQTMCASGQ